MVRRLVHGLRCGGMRCGSVRCGRVSVGRGPPGCPRRRCPSCRPCFQGCVLDEQGRREVDLGRRAAALLGGRRTAQPDPDPVPGGQPTDHEKAHVAGVFGGDLTAGLQPHVGDPPIGVVHAQTQVGDREQHPAVAAACRGHPNLVFGGE